MAVTTGKIRASYVHIFTPVVSENGGEAKYSVTLLIPKSDTVTLNSIYADIERAKQEGAQKVFGGSIPPQCRTPIYDGDGFRPSGEAFGEECRGCMVITASAKQPPVVVGLDMQNILNPADVYSGCYIRANINMFAYNRNGNKGIGCGLNAVQKIEDGEPLSVRVSAEGAFGGANAYAGAPQSAPMGGMQSPYQATPMGGMPPVYQPGAQTSYQPAPTAGMPPVYQPGAQPTYPAAPAAPPTYQPGMPPMYQQAPAGAPQATYPQAPAYGTTAQAAMPAGQIDPITGRPMTGGGVMGI